MVMYLSEERVRGLLGWDSLIAAMETALANFSLGRVIQPARNMLTIEEGKRYLGIMPAVAEDAMGAKLVSFYPGNAGTGMPTHLAMVLPRYRRTAGGDGRPADYRDADSRGLGGSDAAVGITRQPSIGIAWQRSPGARPSASAEAGPTF